MDNIIHVIVCLFDCYGLKFYHLNIIVVGICCCCFIVWCTALCQCRI